MGVDVIMTKEQAIHQFWSSFGLTAYDENTVPDDAKLPYITYSVIVGDYGSSVTIPASLWYHSQSWKGITEKANEIENYIGLGGKIVKHDDGILWIKRASTFSQRMSAGSTEEDKNSSIRRIVLNIVVDYL